MQNSDESKWRGTLAFVVRYIKFLSLLVRTLFMTYGWKVIINHFCHCQKHFTNSLSTLRRTLASFFSDWIHICGKMHWLSCSQLQGSTNDNLFCSKNNFYISKMHLCITRYTAVSCCCIHKTQESSVRAQTAEFSRTGIQTRFKRSDIPDMKV